MLKIDPILFASSNNYTCLKKKHFYMARNSDCDVDGFAKELGPTIIFLTLI